MTAAGIDSDFEGSDHCPIWIDLEVPHSSQGHPVPAMALQHHSTGKIAMLHSHTQAPLPTPLPLSPESGAGKPAAYRVRRVTLDSPVSCQVENQHAMGFGSTAAG